LSFRDQKELARTKVARSWSTFVGLVEIMIYQGISKTLGFHASILTVSGKVTGALYLIRRSFKINPVPLPL
jgi:hypothetical protein